MVGEGTTQALVHATEGHFYTERVRGPLPAQEVEATYGMLGDGETAVIEMAAACGLDLVPPAQRHPLLTTTYGVGELMLKALDRGAKTLIIGVGGSGAVT